jgi:anti-sigma regulatory factor (Ser/Thr protein kinase)
VTTCNNPATATGHDVATRSCASVRPPGALNAPGAQLTYLELESRAGSVPQARRHVRDTLARWGLGDVADDAQLVTSELVTNAIAASAALPFRADVGLLVAACPGQLMLLVWDASQDRPVRRSDDDDAVAGRGLGIVAALTSRWGWAPDERGKVVWAVLDLEGR